MPGNNMQKTVSNFYDNDNPVGGDNLLTSTVRHIDFTNENDYRSDFGYDFRHRRTQTTDWLVYLAEAILAQNTFDNNDNVTLVQQFQWVAGFTALIRQSNTFYDWWQRAYKTQALGSRLGRDYQRAHGPDLVQRPEPAGEADCGGRQPGLHQDGLRPGEPAQRNYTGYSPGRQRRSWSISNNDLIFEQALFSVDATSNTQLVASYQSNQGNTTPNVLTTNARVSYMAFWQDGGGRPIASANYGAAATAPTVPLGRPRRAPSCS